MITIKSSSKKTNSYANIDNRNTSFNYDEDEYKIPVLGNQVYVSNTKSTYNDYLIESKSIHISELYKVRTCYIYIY